MANLQYLNGIYDAVKGTTLYIVTMVTEWDTSFSCPSSVIVVPGVGGGLNTRGGLPNPMGPRVASLKFFRKYGTNENYETVRDTLVGALRNRELRLVVTQPDNSQRQTYGVLTDFTDKRVPETAIIASFDLKFSVDPQWRSTIPASYPQLDSGILLDTGRTMDPGLSVALTADTNTIDLINLGNAPESQCVFTLTGPFAGPITVVNNSDYRGGNFTNFVYYPGLLAGQTLKVDSGINSVLLNGVPDFDPAHFAWGASGAIQREFFRLMPAPDAPSGVNHIGIFHPVGGATGGVFAAEFNNVFE